MSSKVKVAKRVHNNFETFVRAYYAHDNYEDVATQLGIGVASVKGRMYSYRKRNVDITPKYATSRKLNADECNEIISKVKNGQ